MDVRSQLVFFGICMTAQWAVAWCPAPEMKVCSAFFQSDKVFYGKVIKITPIGFDGKRPGKDDAIEKHRYTIKVEQRFKGKVAAIENVETQNTTTRWYSKQGEHRVLFVNDRRVWGLCSPIDEAQHAKETMRTIRAQQNARTATIEGEVYAGFGPDHPVRGNRVSVTGSGRSYEATTDGRGIFSIAVEPGHYRIESQDLHPIEPYSRNDVGGFDLVRGQCAQFQFSMVKP
jgi:hypothetical protein